MNIYLQEVTHRDHAQQNRRDAITGLLFNRSCNLAFNFRSSTKRGVPLARYVAIALLQSPDPRWLRFEKLDGDSFDPSDMNVFLSMVNNLGETLCTENVCLERTISSLIKRFERWSPRFLPTCLSARDQEQDKMRFR